MFYFYLSQSSRPAKVVLPLEYIDTIYYYRSTWNPPGLHSPGLQFSRSLCLVFSSIFHFFGCSFLFSPLLCSHFSVQVYSLVGSRRVRGSPSDAIIVLFRVLHFFHIVYVFSLIYTLSIFSLRKKENQPKTTIILYYLFLFMFIYYFQTRWQRVWLKSEPGKEGRTLSCTVDSPSFRQLTIPIFYSFSPLFLMSIIYYFLILFFSRK